MKGNVDFSRILTEADADARFELWETVALMLEDGEMPPEDEPQLTVAEKEVTPPFLPLSELLFGPSCAQTPVGGQRTEESGRLDKRAEVGGARL